MLLKRISSWLPAHLAAHVPTLEHAGVKTTEHLVFTPQSHLSTLGIPQADLLDLRAYALQVCAPSAVPGDRVFRQESAALPGGTWDGWGVQGLDGLLEDWDGVGVVELGGAKRTGKSLLALHAALRALVKDEQATCRWIDTEGSFSPSRAMGILQAWDIGDAGKVLSRLVVTPCFNVEPDLFQVVDSIKAGLDTGDQTNGTWTRVIVVDPITALFKDTLASTTAQGHAAMVTAMEELAEIAYAHNILVIVTNASASCLPKNELSNFSVTTTKPALGAAFTYHVDASLFIQETGKVFGLVDEAERERVRTAPGLRGVVEVLKSRVSRGGQWAVYETDGVKLYNVVPPPIEDERTRMLSAGMPVGPARPLHGPLRETVIP